MNNVLSVHNVLNNCAPKHFQNYFLLKTIQHDHITINNPKSLYSIPYGSVILPLTKTKLANNQLNIYVQKTGTHFLKALSNKKSKNEIEDNWMKKLKIPALKPLLKEYFFDTY